MVGRGAANGPRGGTSRDERRRALETRLYGGEALTPDEMSELRALAGQSAEKHPSAEPATDDGSGHPASERPSRPVRARPARTWLAAGAVAVVLAGLVGAGISTSVAGSRAPADDAEVTATRGASSPATGLQSGAVAESLGAEYFDQAQSAGDRPDVVLPGIDPSTTRRVLAQWGQQDGEAGVWVARGKDQSFCLIMSVGSTRGASSCTPLKDAAATGVRLDLVTAGGGSISATWNLAAGLLELSPFPAGARVTRSGSAAPTP
ncbi:hypothetical protein GCM10025867_34790 [Frondihabitans sucicola]|uniref:Anti-sigma factor n=1 Tax=Frondihabitans sucicola TaxID=1268041 RepID=A0ABM8GRY7_9MICO|nr:hypothetical protein [Frondihabitans sucicola]BDZ51238.1 hypothetical protein GCM10025867_34790 [Frondihabitans sucicola]